MKAIQTVLLVGGLGYALIGNSAFAQSPGLLKARLPSGNTVAPLPQPLSVQNSSKVDNGNKPSDLGLIDKPGKHGGDNSPDQVKKLLDDIKTSRSKFLQDQKDLQRKLKDATESERDEIRNEMRDKRDQFLEQQKDMREEIIKRVNELKDELKNHQGLIDNAKDPGAGKTKPRKGGGN